MAEFENGLLSTLNVHSVVQDLSSDATTLLSIFYSITPSELDNFIEKFARLLLRGSEVNALATNEIISELLTLELDRALWQLKDSRRFMRGDGSIGRLIDALANLSVAAPDGNLVGQLGGVCRVLCESSFSRSVIPTSEADNDETNSEYIAGWTPTGLSFNADLINPDLAGKFSTSELAGLAVAEQQFLLDIGTSPSDPPDSVPLDSHYPLSGIHEKLTPRCTHSPNRSHMQNLSFLMTRSQLWNEKDDLMRDTIDYFIHLEEGEEVSPPSDLNGGVDSIIGICSRVVEVCQSLINSWPEALRRAMWTVMRAISGSGLVETTVLHNEETLYTIEYTAIATIVVHRIISPAIRLIPSLLFHNDTVDDKTQRRFEWIASLLEKAAYAESYASFPSAAYLNGRCCELTDQWVSFFLSLTKFNQVPQTLWPVPMQSNCFNALSADQELALAFFEVCDRSFISYVHTSMLLRPMTETLHITVWMRFTRYLQRLKLGRVVKCFDVKVTEEENTKSAIMTKTNSIEGLNDDEVVLQGGAHKLNKTNYVYFVSPSNNSLSTPVPNSPEEEEDFPIDVWPEDGEDTIDQYEMLDEIISYARSTFHSVKNNILLSNFCSIIGCDEDGAAVIVLYGDLLSCYLSNFEKGKETLIRFKEYCPKFFRYRSRYLRYLSTVNPDGKYNQWNDGDSIAHIFFLIDMAIQHNCRSNSFYFIFLTESTNAKHTIDRLWVKEALRFLPRKYREFCKELLFVKTRDFDYLQCEKDFLNFFSKVSIVEDICDLPKALPKVTTYLPISFVDYNLALSIADERESLDHSKLEEKRKSAQESTPPSDPQWEKLRGRWSRSLEASPVLVQHGIWPLGTILSFFEIIVTASCRREWSDGRLRPMLGLPVIGLHDIFNFVVDYFKEFRPTVVDYIEKEPEWTSINPVIYLDPDCRTAAASITDHAGNGFSHRIAASAPVAWSHRTWLYVGGTEEDPSERTAYDAALQRLFFLRKNDDVSVKGGSMNDVAVSLCWGIDSYRFRPEQEDSATGSPPSPTATKSNTTRLIPSCRHMTLHSVWRLLMYNVNRTCRLIQRHTPSHCPFLKMIKAVQERLDLLEQLPDNEQVTSTQKEMINVSSKALRTCTSGEVDIVCLVVGMVSYVKNMDNMRRRVSSTERPPLSLQSYINGTSQLVLGRGVCTEAESRVMEILSSNGKELMDRSGLRYYESCTWHPYSKLLYNI